MVAIKKIILLALAVLVMVGCNIKRTLRVVYFGEYWDVVLMNDSTYLMVPKHETISLYKER